MKSPPVARSHPHIIELLERHLVLAYNHKFSNIAIVMVDAEDKGPILANFDGDAEGDIDLYKGLSILTQGVCWSVTHHLLPKRDESLGKDFVVYNVAHDPLCFDYLVWLVECEMVRRRHGAPAPLKVGFWKGTDPEETMAREGRQQWLDKVFRPALKLIGAVEDDRAVYGHHIERFVPREICRAVREDNEEVPILSTDRKSPFPGCITLTLREADHWPDRNSNVEAWTKFARYLQAQGETVVFVRDTKFAGQSIPGYLTSHDAARNLISRMALYQEAKTNIMVSNGPIGLCLFSKAPWLQFVKIEHAEAAYQANTTIFWRDANGVAKGDQYPWAAPNQRIAWCRDDYENLIREWEEYRPLLAERADVAA